VRLNEKQQKQIQC